MIEVQVLPIGPLRTNVVLVGDPERREAIVVDPAIPSLATLTTQLAERGWRLVLALATHGHWDHMGEMAALATHHKTHHHEELPIGVHPLDRHRLIEPQPLAAPFPIPAVVPTTPGHTEGSISLFDASAGLLLSGDTLFFGGWGRTDLPGGDAAAMLDSLGRLRALDPATRVIPGHGRETMIGTESAWIDISIRTNTLTAARS
ncbi:MAG: MBL fold metallo-hydrolase [Candidatus Aquidulcis sp.]|nr:MAG: MBL fold metallo-hydrolase [Candidatus Aquidulcis sp.]